MAISVDGGSHYFENMSSTKIKIKFLGTGTSTGNPEIGCTCKVCKSTDPKDHRLRASVIVRTNDKNILIDCGPDFRQQILTEPFKKLDAVLITHEHYDHVGGLDDLRPFSRFGDVPVFAENYVADTLRRRIPYCFQEIKYPGVPNISLTEIENRSFDIEGLSITPIRVLHHELPIFGYRIQNFAYLTDLKTIPEEEYAKLKNLDILVIDALRIEPHLSHENLEEALSQIRKIAPQKAYLIHMSHHMGLHHEVEKNLPENVFLSYDGLEIETN